MKLSLDHMQELDMRPGVQVEVCNEENGLKGLWYKAILESIPHSTPGPRRISVRLLKDEFATPLDQISKNVLVRPVPPHHLLAGVNIKEGCVVDAIHEEEWWTGVVIKEIKDGNCLVFFNSPTDIVRMEKRFLRPHLDWVYRRWWVEPKSELQLLRQMREKSIFSSGTMVEVSSKIEKMETVWVPAVIVKEIEEDDNKKKYILKFWNDMSLNCKANKPKLTVDSQNVRPIPPSFWVEEYKLLECVEVFHGSMWRKGIVKEIISQKQYMISLEATKKHLKFDYSALRPLTEWEDGVWKVKQSLLAQGSGNKMASSVMNGNTTLLKQTEEKTQRNASLKKILQPFNNQKNDYEKDSTGDKKNINDNNRKRKREENLSSVAIGETKEEDTTLPFEKKLPIWKTFESKEVFKTFQQNPHFSPLVEIRENSREMAAVGMMLTFSRLVEDVKDLIPFAPVSTFETLNDSFAELEKHGFNVKLPQSRIHKLLSLKDKQTKKMEELKGVEKESAEKETERIEIEHNILELQRRKEETEKQIGKMKSSAATIHQELGDVEIQFQTTASAPW